MKLNLFRSTKETNLFAFTPDLTGGNLPDGFGGWQESQEDISAQIYQGIFLRGLSLVDPVIEAVGRYGFYLIRSGFSVSSALELESPAPAWSEFGMEAAEAADKLRAPGWPLG